ncbi:MAG: formyltransferase family protein, partial [Pseudomonadota bacterium]
PEYPGSYPESFAIWDGATQYGITAHEMAAKVDTGRIVRVSRFDMPPVPDLNNMGDLVFGAAVEMFSAIANHCALSDDDMAPSGDQWAERHYTKRDFAALCQSSAQHDGADLARLKRACGKDFIQA